jgi:DNA-binding winged helix-turn-helix (wHTH) protein
MPCSFEEFSLDISRRELRRGSELISIEPKVFDLLVHLITNRERVVSKNELVEVVWDGRVVSDSALTTAINAARVAIGDSGDAQRLIKTYPRRGVRFVGKVREEPDPTTAIMTGAGRSNWDRGLAKRSHLLPFARRHRLAVVATCSPSGVPQSAVVRFHVNDAFELILTAHQEHRKVANLRVNPTASAVIGWDDMQTLQVEGRAELLNGAGLAEVKRYLASQVPEEFQWRQRVEGIVYIKITPTWMRFSDFGINPASILTLDLAAGTETRAARLYRAEPG